MAIQKTAGRHSRELHGESVIHSTQSGSVVHLISQGIDFTPRSKKDYVQGEIY